MVEIVRKRRKPEEECRTRQVTAVFRGDTYVSAQKIASVRGCSTNNVLNIALEDYIRRNGNEVKEYDIHMNDMI